MDTLLLIILDVSRGLPCNSINRLVCSQLLHSLSSLQIAPQDTYIGGSTTHSHTEKPKSAKPCYNHIFESRLHCCISICTNKGHIVKISPHLVLLSSSVLYRIQWRNTCLSPQSVSYSSASTWKMEGVTPADTEGKLSLHLSYAPWRVRIHLLSVLHVLQYYSQPIHLSTPSYRPKSTSYLKHTYLLYFSAEYGLGS